MKSADEFRCELHKIVLLFRGSESLNKRLALGRKHTRLMKQYCRLLEDDISGGVPLYEVWRNVIGWEHIYQISNLGRIRAHESMFVKTVKGRTMAVYKPETIRASHYNPGGYLTTSFWKNGQPTHYFIHRLVAIHFIDNPNNYQQVMHIDDNPANAYFKNLIWGTQSQNILDCVKKKRGFIGSRNGNSKLKESDIPKIRKMLNSGLSSRKIGATFGIDKYAILRIKHNLGWTHVI